MSTCPVGVSTGVSLWKHENVACGMMAPSRVIEILRPVTAAISCGPGLTMRCSDFAASSFSFSISSASFFLSSSSLRTVERFRANPTNPAIGTAAATTNTPHSSDNGTCLLSFQSCRRRKLPGAGLVIQVTGTNENTGHHSSSQNHRAYPGSFSRRPHSSFYGHGYFDPVAFAYSRFPAPLNESLRQVSVAVKRPRPGVSTVCH